MTSKSSSEVETLFAAWARGDRAALDKLLPLVYTELVHRAALAVRRFEGGESEARFQPEELVHEAYLRLVRQKTGLPRSRTEFLSATAELMRHILVEHAHSRSAQKRRASTVGVAVVSAEGDATLVDLLSLDRALNELSSIDERLGKIVELRVFGGLSFSEVGETLGVAQTTVRRDWRAAKVWLSQKLLPVEQDQGIEPPRQIVETLGKLDGSLNEATQLFHRLETKLDAELEGSYG